MNSFIEELEERCHRIVRNLKTKSSEPTPVTFIGREIAITLERIESIRKQQKELQEHFTKKELYCHSQIMNMEHRPSLKNNWQEQNRLTNEFNSILDQAGWQTRQLISEGETTLHQLRIRLLELLNMYDQLLPQDGTRKSTT